MLTNVKSAEEDFFHLNISKKKREVFYLKNLLVIFSQLPASEI